MNLTIIKHIKYLPILLLVIICSCRTSNRYIHSNSTPKTKGYNVVAYVSGWSLAPISKMPAEKLTHINYAFADLDAEGNVLFVNGNDALKIDTLRQLKKKNPDLKIIVSIGGWTFSKHFSDIVASQNLRNKCAQNIAQFVKQYKLDGIDIDWEYPCMRGAGNSYSPEDKENFTLFLSSIRSSFNALEISQKRKESYILSIATATSANFLKSIEPLNVLKYIDFMHIMSYDYRSGDNWETGHHSNLWVSMADWNHGNCIDKTVTRYINAGIPSDKIILGVPFYGRKWEGVTKQNNGLYQPATTGGMPISYRMIRRNCTPEAGYMSIWDDSAQAPYLWNPKDAVFISYENPQSLRYKVDYMKQKKLNGIMFWEYNSDYNNELLNAIFNYLETDRYAFQKQRDILLSSPHIVGIHPLILQKFFSMDDDDAIDTTPSIPDSSISFIDIQLSVLASFTNMLWIKMFLA